MHPSVSIETWPHDLYTYTSKTFQRLRLTAGYHVQVCFCFLQIHSVETGKRPRMNILSIYRHDIRVRSKSKDFIDLKSTCDVNLLSKLSIIFKEWRVMNNADRGGVIVLFVL